MGLGNQRVILFIMNWFLTWEKPLL